MKLIKLFSSVLVVLLFSCNSIKTSSDFDRSVNFNDYKTFAFTKESRQLPANDLVKNRILNAIASNLKSKGLTESDNPDMLIDLGVKTKEKKDYSTTHYDLSGYYGRRWRIGTGISQSNTKEINYTEGTLVINMVDAKMNQLLWMGSGTGVINDKAIQDENLKASITKILSSFPPTK